MNSSNFYFIKEEYHTLEIKPIVINKINQVLLRLFSGYENLDKDGLPITRNRGQEKNCLTEILDKDDPDIFRLKNEIRDGLKNLFFFDGGDYKKVK